MSTSVQQTQPPARGHGNTDPMLWDPVSQLEALLEVICDRLLDISYLENEDDRKKTSAACLFAQIASEIAADIAKHVGVR